MPNHVSYGKTYNFHNWSKNVNNKGAGADQFSLLNAAMEFAHRKGRDLWVPPGRYNGTSQLDFDNRDGFVLIGQGGEHGQNSAAKSPGTWLYYDGPDGQPAYSLAGIDGCYAEGVFFDTNPQHTDWSVDINGTSDAGTLTEFHRCRFGSSNEFGGRSKAAIHVVRAYRTYIHGCFIAGADNGIWGAESHWTDSDWANSLHVESTFMQNFGSQAAEYGWSFVNPPDGSTLTNVVAQSRRNVVNGANTAGNPNFMKTFPASVSGQNVDFIPAGISVNGGWVGDCDLASGHGYFEGAYSGLTVTGTNLHPRNNHLLVAEGRCEGVSFLGVPIPGGGSPFDFQTFWNSTAYRPNYRVSDSNRIVLIGNSEDLAQAGVETFRGGAPFTPNGSLYHGHEWNGANDRDLMVKNGGALQVLAAY